MQTVQGRDRKSSLLASWLVLMLAYVRFCLIAVRWNEELLNWQHEWKRRLPLAAWLPNITSSYLDSIKEMFESVR